MSLRNFQGTHADRGPFTETEILIVKRTDCESSTADLHPLGEFPGLNYAPKHTLHHLPRAFGFCYSFWDILVGAVDKKLRQ